MNTLKIFSRSISIIFFIHLSLSLTAQNRLLLDKQFIYPGEQLGYTYINKQQEADNMLYLAIVDLQSQEIVDFVFHGLEDKIVEGEINLAKNLVPGYYAMIAAKYGDQEIHYEQFWVRDQNWQALGGREIVVSEEGDFLRLRGRVTNVNTQLSVYFTTNPTLLENPIERNENGEFEFSILKDSVINRDTNLPVWAMLELVDEMDQMAIHRFPIHWPNERENTNGDNIDKSWFSLADDQVLIHSLEVGEFSIESMGEIIILEDPIFPDDTLSYFRSDLPTGKLKLHYKPINADEFLTEELWNFPQLTVEAVNLRIIAQGGEELALELPELINPWVLEGNHFLSMKMDVEARVLEERYTGILLMTDTLDSTLDMVTMRSNDPDKLRANRAVMFTNGQYLLEFRTDDNGAFSINRSEASIYGFEEGRLRYREEESRVRLESIYPTIEQIKDQVPMLLEVMYPKVIEQDAMLSSRAIEVDEPFGNDERTIDLDAVVVEGQNMQERIEAVLNDPFAVDWLNEDWVCQHGVLNGDLPFSSVCIPIIGNHPLSPERIPLHIIYERERLKQDPMSSVAKFKRHLYDPNHRFTLSSKADYDKILLHLSIAWRPYTWDPDDYKDQIGSVKLPKQNKLLVAEGELNINTGQKVWKEYSVNPVVKVKAPILPGTYTLEVSYWDLHHEISSSISYEVLVR
ncbi:hypothetical protein ACFCT7_12520 [Fulvivirgaceae bacterium LMO-SS25]